MAKLWAPLWGVDIRGWVHAELSGTLVRAVGISQWGSDVHWGFE